MTADAETTILLFSYGTLQQEAVQRAQFGRLLEGEADALLGYRIVEEEIRDEQVVALSGLRFHPNLVPGAAGDQVAGTLYFITEAELAAADDYEVDEYRRTEVPLKSGRSAWVYVKREAVQAPASSDM